jgi:hypothetical protein
MKLLQQLRRIARDQLNELAVSMQRPDMRRFDRAANTLRVALVKQDCNEDLYCCRPGTPPLEMLQSTLLRSGPIALFTKFDTQFHILKTEPDPECQLWREKWEPLRWCPPEWFEAYRERVPGRDHGQSKFAQSAKDIDWGAYDLVISVDVSVPARITRHYPKTVFAYYIREIKAPSHRASFSRPALGQDLFLNQCVHPWPAATAAHVVNFPYHFQYCGVFHELAEVDFSAARHGIFVDYHAAREMTDAQRKQLESFGPVYAKGVNEDRSDPRDGRLIPHRSMEPEAFAALSAARYYVKWAGRSTMGTGKMEAIAAGCLSLCAPHGDGTQFIQSVWTSPESFDELLGMLDQLERRPAVYDRELARQRKILDHVGFRRPGVELLSKMMFARAGKMKINP